MKSGTENLIKFQRLASLIDRPRYATQGVLCALWSVTRTNCPQGDIGRFDNEWIAEAIQWDGDPDVLVQGLLDAHWLDPHSVHRLIIHDWSEHCEDSVHMKLARKRIWFADGKRPSTKRMGIIERQQIDEFYNSTKPCLCARHAQESAGMCTACAEKRTTTTYALALALADTSASATTNANTRDIPPTDPPPVVGGCDPDEPSAPRKEKPERPRIDPFEKSQYLQEWWPHLIEAFKAAKPRTSVPAEGTRGWFQWRDTLAKLVRIDGFGESEVTKTIQWVLTSDHPKAQFWKSTVYSFANLRDSSNGATKFQKIFDQRELALKSSMTLEDKYEQAINNGTLT